MFLVSSRPLMPGRSIALWRTLLRMSQRPFATCTLSRCLNALWPTRPHQRLVSPILGTRDYAGARELAGQVQEVAYARIRKTDKPHLPQNERSSMPICLPHLVSPGSAWSTSDRPLPLTPAHPPLRALRPIGQALTRYVLALMFSAP
jgi:hypothetical protein